MFKKATRILAWLLLWLSACLFAGWPFGRAVIGVGSAEITADTRDGAALISLIAIWSTLLATGILIRDRK